MGKRDIDKVYIKESEELSKIYLCKTIYYKCGKI